MGSEWAVDALLTAGAQRNQPNVRGQFPLDCVGRSSTGVTTNQWVYDRLWDAGCRRNPGWDGLPGRGRMRTYVMVRLLMPLPLPTAGAF